MSTTEFDRAVVYAPYRFFAGAPVVLTGRGDIEMLALLDEAQQREGHGKPSGALGG